MTKPNKLKKQVLAAMERAFRAGHELALLDCVVFCRGGIVGSGSPLPEWAFAELARRAEDQALGKKLPKKMGCHARFFTEQEQFLVDARCFEVVNELRKDRTAKHRDEQAWDTAADELKLEPETVRKAYYRAQKRLNGGRHYISLLYLRDPLAYLVHNSLL